MSRSPDPERIFAAKRAAILERLVSDAGIPREWATAGSTGRRRGSTATRAAPPIFTTSAEIPSSRRTRSTTRATSTRRGTGRLRHPTSPATSAIRGSSGGRAVRNASPPRSLVPRDIPDAAGHGADVSAVATGEDATPDTNRGADVSAVAKQNHGQAVAAAHVPNGVGKPDTAGKPETVGKPASPGKP